MDHKNELLISLNISLYIWTPLSTVVTTFTTYFTSKELHIVSTECSYRFRMNLATNEHYCPIQHSMTSPCNEDTFTEVGAIFCTLFTLITGFKVFKLINKSSSSHKPDSSVSYCGPNRERPCICNIQGSRIHV